MREGWGKGPGQRKEKRTSIRRVGPAGQRKIGCKATVGLRCEQDSARRSAPAFVVEGQQDSASAPTPRPHSPCPYAREGGRGIGHAIGGGGREPFQVEGLLFFDVADRGRCKMTIF